MGSVSTEGMHGRKNDLVLRLFPTVLMMSSGADQHPGCLAVSDCAHVFRG